MLLHSLPYIRVKLTRIPANCFSSILQDLIGKDPLASLLLSLPWLLSVADSSASGDQSLRFSEVAFECLRADVSRSLSRSPCAASQLFGSVAGVASLLCVNSALIQKLFYAVKRTCDKWKGVEGGEAREGGGNTF